MAAHSSPLDADEAQHGHYNDGHDHPSEIASQSTKWTPQHAPRRHKTLKKVEPFQGNLVLDSAVPTKLLDMCALRNEREFTHMRYTAATCDPNDFKNDKFTLRQAHYDPPRRTELFIVMTMYNEDEELFCRSMHGVIKNIAHLCKRDRSKTWGKDAWKKVVVCIVSDGRLKVNSRTLSVIAAMGVYQEGVAMGMVNGKPVTAHIYEYTTQISVTPSMEIEGAEKGVVPVQVIFCLKEKNQKKINSHRWFFNAFGPILQPNICVLLDVGTMPGPTSIYHLWKVFDIKSNVGGACGGIAVNKGRYGRHLFNPIVAAQDFEYKMANILYKPLESVFGYITVLPGAFSAYRYIALQNGVTGEGPLQKYFLGEKMHGAGADIFTANMCLAEGRILCWELVFKRGGLWTLHYVKSAYAVTDVPHSISALISQRRRWLNGSFFAAMYTIIRFPSIYWSSHSLLRKFWIHVEMFYQLFNLLFSWFSLGNYYIAFVLFTNTLEHYYSMLHYPNLVFKYFYLLLLIMSFLLTLSLRPQGPKSPYTVVLLGFSLIMVYMMVSAFFLAYKGIENNAQSQDHAIQADDFLENTLFRNIILSTAITIGLCIVSSLLSFEPWHLITSFIPFLLMIPSYITVFNAYSFLDIYDLPPAEVSTNTRRSALDEGMPEKEIGVTVPAEETVLDINAVYERTLARLSRREPKVTEKTSLPAVREGQENYSKTLQTNTLLIWTLSNALLAMVITSTIPTSGSGEMSIFANVYISVILFSITGLTAVRFLGSITYLIVRLLVGE